MIRATRAGAFRLGALFLTLGVAQAAVQTNDTADLKPITKFKGPKLKFNFPGLRIGIAEYAETGCTVFYFPKGATAAVVTNTGAWTMVPYQLASGEDRVDAVVFSGGSILGAEAFAGVAAEIFKIRGYSTDPKDIPLVPGAICFDWRFKTNAVYPDKELGRAALRSAREGVFPLGRRGAGRWTRVGGGIDYDRMEFAGQGGAFRRIGKVKIAVFTVVNALGGIVDRNGDFLWGFRDKKTGKRSSLLEQIEERFLDNQSANPIEHNMEIARRPPLAGNTTLSILVTNMKMTPKQLRHLARSVNGSMHRAIQPYDSIKDGDTFYAVSTQEVEPDSQYVKSTEEGMGYDLLPLAAEELIWDAVLSSIADRLKN